MDVWDYFQHRDREIHANSAAPDRPLFEATTDGLRGRMFGNLALAEEAFLSVFERVVVREGAFEVEKYSYYLIVQGAEVWGYDKDPSHDPPVHGHVGADHKWTEASEISLRKALDLAWEEVDWLAAQVFGGVD